MVRRTVFLLTLLFSALLFVSANAQTAGSIELGMDATVVYEKPEFGDSWTTVSLPVGVFRLGYFITDAIAIEPSFSLSYEKPENTDGLTLLDLGLAFGYNLPVSGEGGALFFIQAGPQLSYYNYNQSDTQFGLGGGTGIKMPVAERLATRIEIGTAYYFESDRRPSGWVLNFGLGFSFFTK